MKRMKNLLTKGILTIVTSAAFLFLVSNIQVTCCGPGYQPTLPTDVNELKRNHKHGANS